MTRDLGSLYIHRRRDPLQLQITVHVSMQSGFVTVGSHTAAQLLVTMLDVEIDLVGDLRALSGGFDRLGTEEGRDSYGNEASQEAVEEHPGS